MNTPPHQIIRSAPAAVGFNPRHEQFLSKLRTETPNNENAPSAEMNLLTKFHEADVPLPISTPAIKRIPLCPFSR